MAGSSPLGTRIKEEIMKATHHPPQLMNCEKCKMMTVHDFVLETNEKSEKIGTWICHECKSRTVVGKFEPN